MKLSARLDKTLHDIWENKPRSLLVIFTLAIGIAAVGTINNTVRMLKRDLFGQFSLSNPASINIYISPFPETLAHSVADMREVALAEPRRTQSVSIVSPNGKMHNLDLIASPDFNKIRVNQPRLIGEAKAPQLRKILLERNSAIGLDIKPGDTIQIETNDGIRYPLEVSGLVHDIADQPFSISGDAAGYISMSTLEWLGEEPFYNQLKLIVAENQSSREHVLAVAATARDRIIEPAGYQVAAMYIPNSAGTPGDHWAKKQIDGVLLVLQIMSILAILLSGGLVFNTISAVLMQQIKQIGIMRSVGATRLQIIALYLFYVLVLSLVALILALPLGLIGAAGLSSIAGSLMNYDPGRVDLSFGILLLQVGLGLVMPLLVALIPILRGTQVSVYDAIYQYGMISGENQRGWLDRKLTRIRSLSPPVLLSLRNTFRNKSRLAFTLLTLTVAGAMFIAVFSSYTTINQQIEELGRYIAFDAAINIPGGANKSTAEREALRIPDIKVAEGWASTNGFIVHSDGSESDRVEIIGLPQDALTIAPKIVSGRWLEPGDQNQVVVNEDLLTKEAGITVGNLITLKINNQERKVEVVGIVTRHMLESRIYMDFDQLSKITGRHNQVDMLRVLAIPGVFSNPLHQEQIGEQLEKRFEDANLSESSSKTRHEIFDSFSQAFLILLVILLLVAVILAVIGGLGLTGAMGINILERTREIGVLRAVGASHSSVRKVVVIEGLAVAFISWLLSAVISIPAGMLLAGAVVRTALETNAVFRYSFPGLIAWLGLIMVIGVLASLAPARDASRLTVREVLSYE